MTHPEIIEQCLDYASSVRVTLVNFPNLPKYVTETIAAAVLDRYVELTKPHLNRMAEITARALQLCVPSDETTALMNEIAEIARGEHR